MTEKSTQAEPTMEEILASIRRIISEDGEQGPAQPSEKVVQMPSAKNQPEPPVEEDVLELTDVVSDVEESEVVEELDVEIEPEMAAEAQAEPEDEPEIEPEAEFEPEPELITEAEPVTLEDEITEAVSQQIEDKLSEWGDTVDPADEEEAIMSEGPSDQARSAFMDLSDLLVAGYQGADNTLEAMVRKMLKPMLKSWLDENLPDIVERVVAREIARLARAKRP